MTNVEILLEKVEKLRGLLLDPHPGLVTWHAAYEQALEDVAEWSPNHMHDYDRTHTIED